MDEYRMLSELETLRREIQSVKSDVDYDLRHVVDMVESDVCDLGRELRASLEELRGIVADLSLEVNRIVEAAAPNAAGTLPDRT